MVTEGPDAGRSASVGKGGLVIGSADDCGLTLTDPTVSRRHAEIARTAEGYLLQDLGSTNGVLVDGTRVERAWLRDGTVLGMGKTILRIAMGRAETLAKSTPFGGMVASAPAMDELFGLLESLAASDVTVLIEGETGTGKELAARAVHDHGPRKKGPFVVFDCSTVPAELMESELFGHEKGAFTGAGEARQGAVQEAEGGTLFLDEIGELPVPLQPKLLRLLDRREFKKVGSQKTGQADIRFVAATNRDLEQQVSEGSFRQDLFFRLSGARIKLPPLRERIEDIPALVDFFLHEAGKEAGRRITLAPEAMKKLAGYSWPGNVRELKNALQTAAVLTRTGTIGVNDLPDLSFDPGGQAGSIQDAEARAVKDALERAGGNKRKAARLLGIAPSTLYSKMKKYGLE
jgi:DNA-binding NtrC family response regulator